MASSTKVRQLWRSRNWKSYWKIKIC
jgi:hypothetical protein